MTKENFIENLTLSEIEEFFTSLSSSEQWKIFNNSIDESNYPNSKLYDFDDTTINEVFGTPWDAFQATANQKIYWSDEYFYIDGCGHIVTVSNAEGYFIEHSDEMEDYIKNNYADELLEYFKENYPEDFANFFEDEDESEE